VRGQARLLEDITAIEDLERVRILFDALERGDNFVRLLELANGAAGVQIFIGADNPLFANTGCSMVVAPFRDSREKILGAIGVIGPTRLNYARIIPLVDYNRAHDRPRRRLNLTNRFPRSPRPASSPDRRSRPDRPPVPTARAA